MKYFLANLTAICLRVYKIMHILFFSVELSRVIIVEFKILMALFLAIYFCASSYYSLTIYAYMSFILWLVCLTCVDELNTMQCQEALEVINYCCAFGPLPSFLDTVFIDISRTSQKNAIENRFTKEMKSPY